MKRKIILSLLMVFLFSTLGGAFATFYIRNTNKTLSRHINFHESEDLRTRLIIPIQKVQSDLYTTHTKLGNKSDFIAEDVTLLEQAAQKCSICHHAPEITRRIDRVRCLIGDYRKVLNYAVTSSSNYPQINQLKFNAADIGNEILVKAEDMSVRPSSKLELLTQDATQKINREGVILVTLLTFVLAVLVAVNLTRSIIKPSNTLVNTTRMISDGDLGFTITDKDTAEFGELDSQFNAVSLSLKNGRTKFEQEIMEHKQTEEALKKSEAFLKTIFDSIQDPFCIIDRDYRIIRANEAYAQMRNKKLGELIGKTCYEALLNRSSVCDECVVQKTFVSGDTPAPKKKWRTYLME